MKGWGWVFLFNSLLWITVWITQKLFTVFFICGLYNFGCCGKMKGFQLFVFNFSTLFVAECYKLCYQISLYAFYPLNHSTSTSMSLLFSISKLTSSL